MNHYHESKGGIALEVAIVFALFFTTIWLPGYWLFGVAALFAVFASWRLRGDSLRQLGLLPKDFSQTKPLLWFVLGSLAILAVIGCVVRPRFWEEQIFWQDGFRQFQKYIGWAFGQQLLLHGYFTNRLAVVFDFTHRGKRAAFLTAGMVAVLFGILHLPNPVLTIGTIAMVPVGAYLFLKSRNVYLLTIAHAILGTATKYLVANPLLEYGMRVGPGFWFPPID